MPSKASAVNRAIAPSIRPSRGELRLVSRFSRSFCLLCLAVFRVGFASEVIYDNSQFYLTNSYFATEEFGDEIALTSSNSVLAQFSVEYYGQFTPRGTEQVRLRLYANDGPDTDPGPVKTIPAPNTVLFDSGPLPIGPGFNALMVGGLAIPAPQVITWTVHFTGLDWTSSSRASLLFYDPPTVGKSFDDFWRHTTNGWQLFRFGGRPIANFSTRVTAAFETPLRMKPPETLPDGTKRLSVDGAPGRSFLLEFSTNSRDWTELRTLTLTNRTLEFVHQDAARYTNHFYRASLLPETQLEIRSIARQASGSVQLVFTGPRDSLYEVDVSTDLQTWGPIVTSILPAGVASFTDRAAREPARFYRVRTVPPVPVLIDPISSHPIDGTQFYQLGLSGPPGRAVVIQASNDLREWTAISTNMFSFTTGAATIVDLEAAAHLRRFYRALPTP